ncbi:O-antigen/teichoic acid export membrane protein [Bradyrhizobium sp. GM2.4]
MPVFASKWGASLYGVWLMLFTIPSFLALGDFGFAAVAGTQLTIRVARTEFVEATQTFQSARAIILAFSTLLCSILLTLIWLLPDGNLPSQEVIPPHDFRLAASSIVVYGWACLQGGIFMAVLRAEGCFAQSTFISAFTYLFEGMLAIAAVLAGGSLFEVGMMYACGRLVGLSFLAFSASRRASWMSLSFSKVSFREISLLLPLATASMTVPISLSCLLQGTALAIGAAASPAQVAVFTSVRTLTRSGVQFGALLSLPTIPEFSAAFARREQAKLGLLYVFTLTSALFVLVPMFLLLVSLGQAFLAAWTHGTISTSELMMALMAGSMVLHGLWTPTSNLLQAMNKQNLYALPYLALALSSIPVTYFLAQTVGALGGAISFLLLDSIMFVLVQSHALRVIATPSQISASLPRLYQKALSIRRVLVLEQDCRRT